MTNKTYKARPWVKAREVGNELVILDLRCGEFFVCKGTGPRAWELLCKGLSVDEVTKTVASRYHVEEDNVRRDMESFLAAMLEKDLLVEEPS